MRRKVLSLLILFAICDRIAGEEGFFTLVGSHLIKIDKTYRASLGYQGYDSEKTFQIGIKNKEEGKKDLGVFKNVTISGSGVKNIDFDVRINFD